jgi:adenosylcobinamide-phosphate synthase
VASAGWSRKTGWAAGAGILAGVLADAALGDPRRGHPVALFGRAAQAVQDRVYADSRWRGAGYAAGCVLAVAAPAAVAQRLTRGRAWLRLAATAAGVWTVTGATSLAVEAERACVALEAGDLDGARAVLPALCGRDPAGLDERDLARAVVESVAENTSDAVLAPLLWGAVAGLPGLAGYRAVNTLDAMVGHRSPRYARFGCASARLDDVANWAPARLTGILAAACSPVVGGRPSATWRAMRRYGGRHPSPNAGRCEAAFAGALGVRLGGTSAYAGTAEHRPVLGQGRAAEPGDIRRAVRLCRTVTIAAAAAAAVVAVTIGGDDEGRASSGGRNLGRGQERAHGRPVPLARPAGGARRPVQGAEHVAELVRHRPR